MHEVWATFVYIHMRDGRALFCPTGLWLTEQEAVDNCQHSHGVAALEVGAPFPQFVNELRRVYCPQVERWESSAAYLAQQRAARLVRRFFDTRPAL